VGTDFSKYVPEWTPPLDAPFEPRWDSSASWPAGQGRADRGLSHNGGYLPTTDYMRQQRGFESIDPASVGTPVPGEDLANLGKFSISVAPPRMSNVVRSDDVPPAQRPKTWLGTDQSLVSNILGGLMGLVTTPLPGFLRDPAIAAASGVGALVDVPVEALGHVPLPWQPDTKQAFELLPMTEEKARMKVAMEASPLEAEWRMSQYVRSHQGDLAAVMHLPQVLAPLIMPDASIVERALMLFEAGQNVIERTVAGSSELHRFDDVMAQPEESLHPELQNVRRRYVAGEFGQGQAGKDRFLDEIVNLGFGFTNDPMVNMVFEMFTDPTIVAGIGTGIALRAVKAGALSRRLALVSQAAQVSTDPIVRGAWRAAEVAEAAGDLAGKMGHRPNVDSAYRIGSTFMRDATPEVGRLVDDVTSKMSRRDQAKVWISPTVEAAARVSEAINSPFGFFGRDNIAKVFGKRFSNKAANGWMAGHDIRTSHRLFRSIRENVDDAAWEKAIDATGRSVAYAERSLMMDNLSKTQRIWGRGESATMMPDHLTPSEVSAQLEKGYRDGVFDDSMLSMEVQGHVERVRYAPVPDVDASLDEAGQRAYYDNQMVTRFGERAVQQLAYVLDVDIDTARRIVGKADEDLISLIHDMHWGAVTRDFVNAKKLDAQVAEGSMTAAQARLQGAKVARSREKAKKTLGERQEAYSQVNRLTIIGPRTLTSADAKTLLDDIAANDTAAVRSAVEFYHELSRNFASSTMDPTDLDFLNRVRVYLEDGIKNERFVTAISEKDVVKLAPTAAQYLTDSAARLDGGGYRVGLAPSPDKAWRAVTDSEGNLVGYSPWMDIDVSPTPGLEAPTRFDVFRQMLMTPIRTENIMQANRRRFMRIGAREFGHDRATSAGIWSALRQAATERHATMRSFTQAEYADIVRTADISAQAKKSLGDRGLMMMTAMAMEGDIMQVGWSSKLTGAMKTQSAEHGNYMSILAEKVYPLIRFNLNPIFLIQEWIEPYFFNILRGQKYGRRMTEDAVEQLAVIDAMNSGLHLTEGLENREFRTIGAHMMRQNAGPKTAFAKTFSKLTRGTGRVIEVKMLNYSLLARKLWADQTIAMWDRIEPTRYSRLEAFHNELAARNGELVPLTREEVVWRDLKHKQFRDPDRASTNIHLWDGARPEDIGRVDGIRKSHLARWWGSDSGEALRLDIAAGQVDEYQFVNKLMGEGYTSEYANRAWDVARSIDVEQLLDDVTRELPDSASVPLGKDLQRGLIEAGAVTEGLTTDEYVARHFTGTTRWLDSASRLPYNAYLKVLDRYAEDVGIPKVLRDDPRVVGSLARAQGFLPDTPHSAISAHRKAGDSASEGIPKLTQQPLVGEVAGVRTGSVGADDFKLDALTSMDEASIQAMSGFYRELMPRFTGVVEMMSDENVRLYARAMNEKMPSLKGLDPEGDLGVLRQEVTARMATAWGATQSRISPRDGLGLIVRVMDDVMRGARPGARPLAAFTPQRTQLWRMLEDFEGGLSAHGLGPKLLDFLDSILGNSERTFMRGERQMFRRLDGSVVPLQPAAVDIWVMRERGFIDSEYLGYLASKIARDRQVSEAEGLVAAQLETGVYHRSEKDSVEVYRQKKESFEREHGVTLREETGNPPTAAEYEHVLLQLNRLADELSQGEGWQGRSYANGNPWTAADVQSISWTRIHKALGVDPGGPLDMFHQNAAQVAFETLPSVNSPLYEELGLHRANANAQDMVTGEMATALAPMVADATGVTITRVIPGRGGWRRSADEYTFSPNTSWEMLGSPDQVQDAIDYLGYLTHQEVIFGTKAANPRTLFSSANDSWAIDFVPERYDAETLDALGEWIEGQDGFSWNGHMVASREGDTAAVRSVFTHDDLGQPDLYATVPVGTDAAGFEAAVPLPNAILAKLQDGSWALEAKLDAAVPVAIERRLHTVVQNYNDWGADQARAVELTAGGMDEGAAYRQEMGRAYVERLEARGRSDVAREMVGRDMATVQAVASEALKRADPDAYAAGRGVRHFRAFYPLDRSVREPRKPALGSSRVPPRGELSGALPDDAYGQRRGRGWAGATAFVAQHRADLYLNRQTADLTTLVHENFHVFARNLQPSAINAIHDIYGKATKRKKPTSATLDRKAEEWVAAHFEQYMGSGIAPDPSLRLHQVFNAYADWGQKTGKVHGGYDARLMSMFDSLSPEVHGRNMAVWDAQEYMLAEAARQAWVAAEEEAYRVHFFKRGRTWLERSLNHPYLGMYPLSYMWGKVLPELLRFLVRKPFGVDAPFAGVAMANHVYNAVQLELNTDSGIAELVKDTPEMLHLLELLLPGNPYNLPVNIPAWSRRLASQSMSGQDVSLEDTGRALTDTLQYAFGPGRAPGDLSKAIGDLTGLFAADEADDETDSDVPLPLVPPVGVS